MTHSLMSGMAKITIALLIAVLPIDRAFGEEILPRTGIFILVDLSATWNTQQSQDINNAILAETNRAVLDLIGKAPTPAAIYMISIEADSVLNVPFCEVTFRRKLINVGASISRVFSDRTKLENYLEQCRVLMLKRPVAKWTDIHGALDLVARLAASSSFSERYMFVLSDFKEERPKGPLPTISLPGFRVASIYRVLPEDSRDPKALEDRLRQWDSLLKQAGAIKNINIVDKGRFAGHASQKLLSDE